MKRVAVVGLWHETNTYASHLTQLTDFQDFELLEGDGIAEKNFNTGSVIGGFLDSTEFELVPVFSAGAWPSGPVERNTFDQLLGRIEHLLRARNNLDGVLLNLHGATVAEHIDDVEAEVVKVVRDVVGQRPIAAVLDLHGNPSRSFIQDCDMVISYDTYPHVDMRARGLEAARLMSEALNGAELCTSAQKVPLLMCPLAQGTEPGSPFERLQQAAKARAKDLTIRRTCIVGGFAYSDVARAGVTVLAVHRRGQEADAGELLDFSVERIHDAAQDFAVTREDATTAVRRALSSTERPVFLADTADNIGGGSPGDGTVILRELLNQGAVGAVVTIADPEVVELARAAGPGSRIHVLVGGKVDRLHGEPVSVEARVERLSDGNYRSSGYYMTNRQFSMGPTAVLSVAGNTLIVTARATPPFHSEQLTSLDIDPHEASVVVVKGAIAWRAAYSGVPAEVIEVATPGVCPVDISSLPRRTSPATA